jgi:hypothetical protein
MFCIYYYIFTIINIYFDIIIYYFLYSLFLFFTIIIIYTRSYENPQSIMERSTFSTVTLLSRSEQVFNTFYFY